MSSCPASAIPADPADLLPECPELQVPSGTITIAEANLYRMMELLASSDNLSFDLHLKYIERIAEVQEKLLAMRKAIYQLDCAIADRQAANQAADITAAIAPAAPSAAAQPANSTAAIAAVDAIDPTAPVASPAAPNSPNESPSLNHTTNSLGQIAPIPEIPPLAHLVSFSSGLVHSSLETSSSSSISSSMATRAVAATPPTPATRATRACSANQILNQLSQAIAGIDQLSNEIQSNLEKAVPPGASPASTIAHQSSTPTNNHSQLANDPTSANLSAPSPISDA